MDITEANGLIAQYGLKKGEIARMMGIDPSLLTRYLTGERKVSDQSVSYLFETIYRLNRAEAAATEAREAVLRS